MSRQGDRSKERDDQRESGLPGGGAGRRDEAGGSGVYPQSAPNVPEDAVTRGLQSWGQGDRGSAGYDDAGASEVFSEEEVQRMKAEQERKAKESGGKKGERGSSR
jgi:hypothetical protein